MTKLCLRRHPFCLKRSQMGEAVRMAFRRSRCDSSGGRTSRNRASSPLKQPTTSHKFAKPDSFRARSNGEF